MPLLCWCDHFNILKTLKKSIISYSSPFILYGANKRNMYDTPREVCPAYLLFLVKFSFLVNDLTIKTGIRNSEKVWDLGC